MSANSFIEIVALMRAAKCGTIKIENEPFMPLCVEFIGTQGPFGLGRECVSFCHYGEQNGDAMRDPEVCFEIVEGGVDGRTSVLAYLFRNDYAGAYSEAVEDGVLVRSVANDLNAFALLWSQNLIEQGFIDAARIQLAAPANSTETATASAFSSNG